VAQDISYTKTIVADPTPLGLFGLAMVTLVASSQKLGLTSGLSLVLPWAIFLGAFVQLIACFFDFKHNNVFGATAFGAYAFFWFGVAFSWMVKMGILGDVMASQADAKQLGFAFIGYLIFTLFMTIGAIETNKVLLAIFVLIDLLFLGLIGDVFGLFAGAHTVAAYAELGIALLSFYGSGAILLNQHFGKRFLPLGKPLGIFKTS
jgi:succinate-acetate transporter protein